MARETGVSPCMDTISLPVNNTAGCHTYIPEVCQMILH